MEITREQRETRTVVDGVSQEGPVAPKGYTDAFSARTKSLGISLFARRLASEELPKPLKMIELAFGEGQ
jgi:hypothetical protein